MTDPHEEFMALALAEAAKAGENEEVPVGAVLVSESGRVISSAHNQTITLSDRAAHAEILALRHGGARVANYRLLNTTVYVTVEPCVMCMGAILHARVAWVVFGARDPKWGAAGSLYDFSKDKGFNHCPEIIAGVLQKECKTLIQNFFRAKRKK